MQAIQYTQIGSATTTDLAVPSLRPGHALVQVMASGLCHTDIDVLYGRYGNGTFPLVPGHEFSGRVVAVAEDVTDLEEGARVVVDPNIPCGSCRSCQKGRYNLCRDLKAYGVTTDGGFAEYAIVDAKHLHDIGKLSFHTAALAEPLACVLNGLAVAGYGDASNALVFGAGPIGLLLALSLRARGVKGVAVADINEDRLRFAETLGLRPVVSGSGDLKAKHFDFVADATGLPKIVGEMISYTADGGTALVFGVCAPDAFVKVAPFEIFRRQIRLVGSHSLNKNIPEALSILHQDDCFMEKLVSHRLPLAELIPFFRKGGASAKTMKVQFSEAQ
ncbi:alcohol dehydrogenase catalytic domain-containing protein [Rhizobium sp. 2YAF20]|uniref:alcohol dehydrogenase catalytic domain-containing protein n=1 Tax=Rhizobium sp. 2YAF20 TaxID=3233027 RepID=UPI003F9C69FB